MPRFNAPFEIHVHGQVALRKDVQIEHVSEALGPIWKYAGAKSLSAGSGSSYDEEPGIQFDGVEQLLRLCWTVPGDMDFRQVMDEACMNINDLALAGSAIEVTFYDVEYDEDDERSGVDSRDDFMILFVGPDPAAIMQVQRDILVQDLISLMERHFDGAELGGVIAEVDKMFSQRFDSMVKSLALGKPPSGSGGGSGGHNSGGRKPRHLH